MKDLITEIIGGLKEILENEFMTYSTLDSKLSKIEDYFASSLERVEREAEQRGQDAAVEYLKTAPITQGIDDDHPTYLVSDQMFEAAREAQAVRKLGEELLDKDYSAGRADGITTNS